MSNSKDTAASVTHHPSEVFPAFWAFLDGNIFDALLPFELHAAAAAFIFIRGHNLCSLLFFQKMLLFRSDYEKGPDIPEAHRP
jgi:hypothetical protein